MDLCRYNENITPEMIREFKDEIGMKNNNGTTDLIYLCQYNKNISQKLIRELKNEIGIKNNHNYTALIYLYIKNKKKYYRRIN